MTDNPHAAPPPSTLLLATGGPCDFDPEHLLDVFGEQRQRFVTVLRDFGPPDWAAPTRCADWSAHEVLRHLCDGNARAIAAVPMPAARHAEAFDPRVTPRQGWPRRLDHPMRPSAASSDDRNCSPPPVTGCSGPQVRRPPALRAHGLDRPHAPCLLGLVDPRT